MSNLYFLAEMNMRRLQRFYFSQKMYDGNANVFFVARLYPNIAQNAMRRASISNPKQATSQRQLATKKDDTVFYQPIIIDVSDKISLLCKKTALAQHVNALARYLLIFYSTNHGTAHSHHGHLHSCHNHHLCSIAQPAALFLSKRFQPAGEC
jgi:hypothetical protein